MGTTGPEPLDIDARDEYLAPGGTGVLAIAAGAAEPPHAIPVSYGYDPDAGRFYFRLAFEPDSTKADLVAEETPVTFVTFTETDDRWVSVIASGRMHAIAESADEPTVLDGMARIHIPLVEAFDRPPQEVTFRFFALDPASVAGRTGTTA